MLPGLCVAKFWRLSYFQVCGSVCFLHHDESGSAVPSRHVPRRHALATFSGHPRDPSVFYSTRRDCTYPDRSMILRHVNRTSTLPVRSAQRSGLHRLFPLALFSAKGVTENVSGSQVGVSSLHLFNRLPCISVVVVQVPARDLRPGPQSTKTEPRKWSPPARALV